MRKIFFLVAIFFPLLSQAAMQPYPEKLGDFSRWGAFDDVYMKVYQDTYGESDTNSERQMPYESEILDRISQHGLKKRSAEEGDNYTQEEIDILSELGVPDLHEEDVTGQEEQVSTSRNFQNLYKYERDLLQLQNQLARKNGLTSIFENDSLADSPFDIAKDLRSIDKLLFGEKYEFQQPKEPSFLTYDTEKEFSLDPEDWQDQRKISLEEKFSSFSETKYGQQTDSLTGAIAGIVFKPLDKLLSVSSLVGESSSKGMFEHTGHSGTAQGGQGSGAGNQKVATPDKSDPLVYQVQTEDIGTGLNLAIEKLLESNCIETDAREERLKEKKQESESSSEEEVEDKYLATSNRLGLFFRCQDAQKADFLSDLKLIEEKADFDTEKNHFKNILPRLLNWNKDVRSFLNSTKKIREIFQKDFITKPQK